MWFFCLTLSFLHQKKTKSERKKKVLSFVFSWVTFYVILLSPYINKCNTLHFSWTMASRKPVQCKHKIQFYEIEHWTEYNKYIIDIMIQWAQKLFSWLKKPIDACYCKNWTKKKELYAAIQTSTKKWKSKKSEAWMATEWNSSNNNKTTTKQVVWAFVSIGCMQNFINSDGIKFRTISTKPETLDRKRYYARRHFIMKHLNYTYDNDMVGEWSYRPLCINPIKNIYSRMPTAFSYRYEVKISRYNTGNNSNQTN